MKRGSSLLSRGYQNHIPHFIESFAPVTHVLNSGRSYLKYPNQINIIFHTVAKWKGDASWQHHVLDSFLEKYEMTNGVRPKVVHPQNGADPLASGWNAFSEDSTATTWDPESRQLNSSVNYVVCFDQLLLFPRNGFYSVSDAAFLREAVVPGGAPTTNSTVAVVNRAKTRRISNFDQVVEEIRMITKTDPLVLTDFPEGVVAQSYLLKSITMLVSVHGAGMSNMIFMPQRSVIVEILPYGSKHIYSFDELGRSCGHDMLHLYNLNRSLTRIDDGCRILLDTYADGENCTAMSTECLVCLKAGNTTVNIQHLRSILEQLSSWRQKYN
mmetsp:Transcript_1980/g.2765  ORF Transcript_1980/g.2765 Transcript_1980/m.2765 type:complete len:326 (+) Transcript_1980:460-1437(+)